MCTGVLKIIKVREQLRKPSFSLALAVSLAAQELPALPGADMERLKKRRYLECSG